MSLLGMPDGFTGGGSSFNSSSLSPVVTSYLALANTQYAQALLVSPIAPNTAIAIGCKLRITEAIAEKVIFNLGSFIVGESSIALRISEDGFLTISRYNGVTLINEASYETSIVSNVEYIIVALISADGAISLYVNTLANLSTAAADDSLSSPLEWINLNGAKTISETSEDKIALDLFYAYVYTGELAESSVELLLASEHPNTVGTVRQGYNLNGDTTEVSGGPSLTLYNDPIFYSPTTESNSFVIIKNIYRSIAQSIAKYL